MSSVFVELMNGDGSSVKGFISITDDEIEYISVFKHVGLGGVNVHSGFRVVIFHNGGRVSVPIHIPSIT